MRKRRSAGVAVLLLSFVASCTTSADNSATLPTGNSPASALGTATSPNDDPSSGPDATTTTTPDPPDPPSARREVTVVMNGDMLLHSGLWDTARIDARTTGRGPLDFRPLLADLRPVVSGADLAICHLETPLAPAGGPFASYPVFSVPPAIVPALTWEGFDACTTASNHSLDQGFEGIRRTIADFDRAGLAHAGTAITRNDSITPVLLDAGGVTVGLISATYGTNGFPLPADQPWSVPLIRPAKISRLAAKAKAAGADVVLVALHWGLEYQHEPSTDQLDIAAELSQSPDIDFIYGHHAHVVQPYDKVHGTWVVYGLGNAVAQQDTAVEGVYDGNTCRVTFRERSDGSFAVAKLEYIPTMITHFDGVHPMRWLDVPQSLADPADSALHAALAATEKRVAAVVNLEHAFSRGVVEGD